MAATPSIKITKQFTYKGQVKYFSNRYHFNGGTPADGTHWTTFSDAIVTAEKAIYPSYVSIIASTGYAAGSDVPVFSKTYSTPGTFTVGTSMPTPGDAVMLERYSTAARTPKNHPVYLFNYYHGVRLDPGGGDLVYSTQKTSLGTYASAWLAGFSDGTNTLVRAGPNGATATGHSEQTYITHRDFPR